VVYLRNKGHAKRAAEANRKAQDECLGGAVCPEGIHVDTARNTQYRSENLGDTLADIKSGVSALYANEAAAHPWLQALTHHVE